MQPIFVAAVLESNLRFLVETNCLINQPLPNKAVGFLGQVPSTIRIIIRILENQDAPSLEDPSSTKTSYGEAKE